MQMLLSVYVLVLGLSQPQLQEPSVSRQLVQVFVVLVILLIQPSVNHA